MTVEVEFNTLQFFSGIEQRGVKNIFCRNRFAVFINERARFCDRKSVSLTGTKDLKPD